jgi:hypothetical protein
MMLTIHPFHVEHMFEMNHQARNLADDIGSSEELFKALETDYSYTFMNGAEIVCCCGVVSTNDGRGIGWAYLADDLDMRTMVRVSNLCETCFSTMPFHRIELQVDCDFEKAHNWARHLGFEMECERMRAFTPDKRDCALYARVRL